MGRLRKQKLTEGGKREEFGGTRSDIKDVPSDSGAVASG